ncbi:hypothetical protein LEP3755_19710 [Leptolyngbya sp. NIES-3755]|nr:hypothetical protein LEP3755_19710 [Leptolyngbya sp. NIES-3755]
MRLFRASVFWIGVLVCLAALLTTGWFGWFATLYFDVMNSTVTTNLLLLGILLSLWENRSR